MTQCNLRVVVLGAQRMGVIDPLAARFGTTHKCFIPLQGRPLIAHVLETLGANRRVADITVSIEPDAFGEIDAVAAQLGMSGRIRTAPAAANIADSVLAATQGLAGPFLITTADNALLTGKSIERMADALKHCDAAMAFAREESVRSAHAEGQRRFYQFRDDGYSNCNLYGIADRSALTSAEVFRGGGQFAKKAKRIIDAFGLLNLLLLRSRLITMEGAMRRISRRFGMRIAAVVLQDGSQAIDVDNDRTYAVVETLLLQRMRGYDWHRQAA